jgi:predicted DNA-binding protein with PD1-like motif
MQFKRTGEFIVIRLEPGEEVHAALLAAVQAAGAKQGIVLSGIGQLREVKLGFLHAGADGYSFKVFNGPAEVLALVGNISLKDGAPMAHLHAVLGRDDFSVFGGHFAEGFVTATLEVAVRAVGDGVVMERRPEGAMMGLYIS